jgi:protein transport protein SEC13
MIHRETRPRDWTCIHHARGLHESSVNGLAFAPPEYGLVLAAASSDGRVSILQHQANNQTWTVDYISDCPMGVNAVSWAPVGSFLDPQAADALGPPRLVTAGCDNQIRFWVGPEEAGGEWREDTSHAVDRGVGHTDWVRDVAWAPCLLPNHNQVASCSEDGTVLMWELVSGDDSSTTSTTGSTWKATLVHKFDDPVWRVSWSTTGYMLAVSSGDANVTLWKAGVDGTTWVQMNAAETAEAPTMG